MNRLFYKNKIIFKFKLILSYATILFACLFSMKKIYAGVLSCEVEIIGNKKNINNAKIKLFFRTTDTVIRNLFYSKTKADRKTPRSYKIIENKKNTKQTNSIKLSKKGSLTFNFSKQELKNFDSDDFKARIICAVILKYAKMPVNRANLKQIPPWLIYGCLAKIKTRLDKSSIPGITFAPAVHAFVVNAPQGKTNFIRQITSKHFPKSGPAFKLFLEFSNILIDSIKKLPKWRDGLMDLIELSMKNHYSPTFFEQIFSKKVHTFLINTSADVNQNTPYKPQEFENWFFENALRMSVNIFNPANAMASEKMFRKVEIVNYTAEFENNAGDTVHEERCCKIMDLPDKKSEIFNFDALVKHKEFEFTLLAYSVPTSFQPSIFDIKKALIKLRAGISDAQFKNSYTKAKNNFFSKVSKQYEIETYMEKMKKRFVPEIWRYRYELIELEKYKTKRAAIWPDLNEYISNWGKKQF